MTPITLATSIAVSIAVSATVLLATNITIDGELLQGVSAIIIAVVLAYNAWVSTTTKADTRVIKRDIDTMNTRTLGQLGTDAATAAIEAKMRVIAEKASRGEPLRDGEALTDKELSHMRSVQEAKYRRDTPDIDHERQR